MRATVIAGALLALVAMQSTWVDGAGASSIAGRHPVTSTTTPPTPVQACLQTTLTLGRPHVGSALKLAVCNDVVKDLIGIGQRFGLQVITPSTAANNPMTMIYT